MSTPSSTRREFLTAASAAAAAAMLPVSVRGAEAAPDSRWAIGCHTRPFAGFRATQASNPDFILDAVKAAGYEFADMISAGGGGGRNPAPAGTTPAPAAGRGGPPTAEATEAYKQKLAARGLKSNIASLPTPQGPIVLADAIANARRVIANAQILGQKYALNLGVEQEERWVDWCKVLSEAAAYGKERGVKVWIKQVNHPTFGVFVDPGNIVYYTGKDPVKQIELIGPHVSGVVAKDCSAPHFMEREVSAPPMAPAVAGAGNPEVMIQFGTGKVDFAALFAKLKSFGFKGPVMVEGTEVAATLEQTIANARANREFLEKIFASL
jgi:sugar phosphate isomerase/epimerase